MAEKREGRKQVREAGAAYHSQPPASPETATDALADWEWVRANRSRLEEEYAGRWVAVADRRVVGTGVKLSTAMKRAAKAGYDHPLVLAFKEARYRGMPEVPLFL